MDGKKLSIGIDINLDMQTYYDNLLLYKACIDAQIYTLAKSPSICTHKEVIDVQVGDTTNKIKMCKCCSKVIDGGAFDYCK